MTRNQTKPDDTQGAYKPDAETIKAATDKLKANFTPTEHWVHTHDQPYRERHYTFPVVGRR